MKVFYIASARIEDKEMGEEIYRVIEELGQKHTSGFMVEYDRANFYKADEKEWRRRYRARLREIAKAEVCVFEASMHSLAIGQLVQEAISREKPTIVLYQSGKKPQFMTGTAEAEKRVLLLEYDEKSLKSVLEYGFEIAKELLTVRFTMLMPAEYSQFLDKINSEDGVSRSDYIRGLIKQDMKRRNR